MLCCLGPPSLPPSALPTTLPGTYSTSVPLHIAALQECSCFRSLRPLFLSQDVPPSLLLWSGVNATSSRGPSLTTELA